MSVKIEIKRGKITIIDSLLVIKEKKLTEDFFENYFKRKWGLLFSLLLLNILPLGQSLLVNYVTLTLLKHYCCILGGLRGMPRINLLGQWLPCLRKFKPCSWILTSATTMSSFFISCPFHLFFISFVISITLFLLVPLI